MNRLGFLLHVSNAVEIWQANCHVLRVKRTSMKVGPNALL